MNDIYIKQKYWHANAEINKFPIYQTTSFISLPEILNMINNKYHHLHNLTPRQLQLQIQPNKIFIINTSIIHHEKLLLHRGWRFAPTPKKRSNQSLHASFKEFSRILRWNHHWHWQIREANLPYIEKFILL